MHRESNIIVFFPPALLGYSPWTSQDFSVFFAWACPPLWLHRRYFSGCRRNLFVLHPFRTTSSPSSSACLTSLSSSTSWIVRAWSIHGASPWFCVGNRTSESLWCFQDIFSIPVEDLLLKHGNLTNKRGYTTQRQCKRNPRTKSGETIKSSCK